MKQKLYIQTVINGALDSDVSNDASILANKAQVGLAFANYGFDDVTEAKAIIDGVSDDDATISTAFSI